MDKIRRAAALSYDRGKHNAPVVVAAGSGRTGEEIERIAREHDIPVVENESLVQLLIQTGIGNEVPPNLYQVVAEIFAYVMKVDAGYPG